MPRLSRSLPSLPASTSRSDRELDVVGVTVWLTGLSGAGKTTIGTALVDRVPHAILLDGDVMRSGLNSDLGFTRADRSENIRRLGEVALLISKHGVLSVVAAISPFAVDRESVRVRHRAAGVPFIEVFVSTPLAVCEGRDPKSLYREARAGSVRHFTGVSDTYEAPTSPELDLPAHQQSVETSVSQLLQVIERQGASYETEPMSLV
jgi:bifunctional enzyme CysN/CysC